MLEELKEKVFKANLDLVKYGLVIFTWGNVSEIDKESGLVVIKPSGVSYDKMKASDMVVVDLDGKVVEGTLNPSSDTPTHLEIYKAHKDVGGVVHTHSTTATGFAQSGKPITALGTTHADYFYGDIPCTRALSKDEIEHDYEKNTGKVINETFSGIDFMSVPGVIVKNHGPFAWGKDGDNAVYNAVVLEEVAKMAVVALTVNPNVERVDQFLLDKHYMRKHGKNAYYGQKNK
ncbi:MAG: L-ribulose-5-phosphate 4-epimerase [Clostridia bacterium]